jgi:hypothetical protein
MMHPLASYMVAVHLNDLMAEAEYNRLARQARQPRKAGIVASFRSFVRNLFSANDAHSAASPA